MDINLTPLTSHVIIFGGVLLCIFGPYLISQWTTARRATRHTHRPAHTAHNAPVTATNKTPVTNDTHVVDAAIYRLDDYRYNPAKSTPDQPYDWNKDPVAFQNAAR